MTPSSKPPRSNEVQRKAVAATAASTYVMLPARRFWSIVLASLLMTETPHAKVNASDAPSPVSPPEPESDNPQALVLDETTQEAASYQLPADAVLNFAPDAEPSSALDQAVRQWLLGTDAQEDRAALEPTTEWQIAAAPAESASRARTSNATSGDSLDIARRAFRSLFAEELGADDSTPAQTTVATSGSESSSGFSPMMLLGLLGLGGGGGGGGAAAVSMLSGTVVKGYLKGSVVWRDGNNDGIFNGVYTLNADGTVSVTSVSNGDTYAITDASGHFTNLAGSGDIHVFGGVDIYGTGLKFTGALSAPSTASVVTPLTTLIAQTASANHETATQAASRVATALGLNGTATASDLLSIDPIALAVASSTSGADKVKALTIYAKAAQVANLLVSATTAVKTASGNALDDTAAAAKVMASMALQIINNPGSVDLTASSFVQGVLTGITLSGGKSLTDLGSLADIATSVANVNGAFGALAYTPTPTRVPR